MVDESLVAENLLIVTGYLPDKYLQQGRELLSYLEKKDIPVTAAFWQFVEEREKWRFFLATPLTDLEGPVYVYSLIRGILSGILPKETGGMELTDISVISPDARIIADLRRQYGMVMQENERRVRRVDGPYIYRLTLAQKEKKTASAARRN